MIACCLVGACAAGFAVPRIARRPVGPAARAAALACAIGLGWVLFSLTPDLEGGTSVMHVVGRGLHSLLLYLPVGFVLEEVSFRGAVDAHVHRPGESLGWLTAIYVSALWALWHVPIDLGTQPLGDLVVSLLVVHVTIGVPLSFTWRRSGNLTLPVAVHAVVDAVRDALSSA
jgi:membrane protease YdiL (CAAX protease family)